MLSCFGLSVAVVSDCHRLDQSIMGSEAVDIAVNLRLSLTARQIQQAMPRGEVPNTPFPVVVKATATITPSPQIRPPQVPPLATPPHASDYVLALLGDLRLSLTAQDIEQAMPMGESNTPFPVVVEATATLIPSSAFLRPRIRPPPAGPPPPTPLGPRPLPLAELQPCGGHTSPMMSFHTQHQIQLARHDIHVSSSIACGARTRSRSRSPSRVLAILFDPMPEIGVAVSTGTATHSY
jgi:hypothetical protein